VTAEPTAAETVTTPVDAEAAPAAGRLAAERSLDPAALAGWLAGCGFRLLAIEALPGDVSSRHYYRLALEPAAAPAPGDGEPCGEIGFGSVAELSGAAADGTSVLALYPPEMRSVCDRFLATTELLAGAGVRVPRVLASDCEGGRVLVEDLGPETLHEWAEGRPWSELAPLYRGVLEPMRRIARLPAGRVAALSPPLDRALLERELEKTWRELLTPRRLGGPPATERAFAAALADLCGAIAAVPPVPCHRDLTPRNLVPVGGGGLAMLDHQDLRLGPPLYDLAALLNDTLFPPPPIEDELLAAWGTSEGERVDYHRVAAQRTLKAAGTYAGAAAAGNPRRLALLPPTLRRALDHLAAAPETRPLAAELAELWLPAMVG